jgi:hypothetical protein
MSYYDNWEYEDNGNHSDDGYNEYLDHAESAYSEHTPSKLDYYEKHKGDTQYHEDGNHEDGPEGYEYEQGELEYEGEGVHELEELGHERDKICESEGLKYERQEIYEHLELIHDDNEECTHREHRYETEGDGQKDRELNEDEHKVHKLPEPEYHNGGMDNGVCEPQGPRYDDDEALKLQELERMYMEWGHEPPTALYNEHGDTSGPTHTHPTTPSPPHSPAYDDGNRYTDNSNTILYSPDHSDPTLNLLL